MQNAKKKLPVYVFIFAYTYMFIPSLMTPHPTIFLLRHLNTIISQAPEHAAVVLRGWFCINSTTPRFHWKDGSLCGWQYKILAGNYTPEV